MYHYAAQYGVPLYLHTSIHVVHTRLIAFPCEDVQHSVFRSTNPSIPLIPVTRAHIHTSYGAHTVQYDGVQVAWPRRASYSFQYNAQTDHKLYVLYVLHTYVCTIVPRTPYSKWELHEKRDIMVLESLALSR